MTDGYVATWAGADWQLLVALVRDHLLIHDSTLKVQQRWTCAQAGEFLRRRTATFTPARGVRVQANTPYVATLVVHNSLGHPHSVSLESIEARWVGAAGKERPRDTVSVAAVPDQAGHYALTITIGTLGAQRLSLMVFGQEVPGSPLALTQLVRRDR